MKPTIFILSAEHAERSLRHNTDATAELAELLTDVGLAFGEVEGYYNGHRETSFLVVGAGAEHDVCQLARQYNQESYLRSDSDRNTYLVNPDTDVETYIGTLRETTPEQAKRNGAYTFDPVTGTYWCATTDAADLRTEDDFQDARDALEAFEQHKENIGSPWTLDECDERGDK